MSTKIYNGRIIRAPLAEAYSRLIRLKEKALLPAWRDQWRATYTQLAVARIDDAAVKGEVVYGAISSVVTEAVDAHFEIKRTGQRNPLFDNSSEIWLFPSKGDEHVYAIMNAEWRGASDLLDSQRWFEVFSYWNNTDPPEGMTAKEWSFRRRTWNRLMGADGIPAHRCLTLELTPLYPPFHFELGDMAAYLPHVAPTEQRLQRVVANKHRGEVFEELLGAERETRAEPDWQPDGFGFFLDADREARSESRGQRRAEISAQLAGCIHKLTPDSLNLQRGKEAA